MTNVVINSRSGNLKLTQSKSGLESAGKTIPGPLNVGYLPATRPITTGSLISSVTIPIWSVGSVVTLGTIAILAFLVQWVGLPAILRVADALRNIDTKIEAWLDDALATDSKVKFVYFFARCLRCALAFLESFVVLLSLIARYAVEIVLVLMLMYVLLALEANAENAVQMTGVIWDVTRQGWNVFGAVLNGAFLFSNYYLVPGWNGLIRFVGELVHAAAGIVGPFIVRGTTVTASHDWSSVPPENTPSITNINGLNGRRRLVSMSSKTQNSTNYYQQFRTDGDAEFPELTTFLQSGLKIVELLALLSNFAFLYYLILFQTLMDLLLNFPDSADLLLSLTTLPFCFLQFPLCAILQGWYWIAVIFFETVAFILGSVLSFFGIPVPSRATADPIQCHNPPSSANACNECILAFPGWGSCPSNTGTSGRRLITCEQTNEKSKTIWYESIGERTLAKRREATTASEGCPLTHRAFHPLGNAENMRLFNRWECYDVCVNGTLVHSCPWNLNEHGTFYAMGKEPCGPRAVAARSAGKGRRRRLSSSEFDSYLSSAFGRSGALLIDDSQKAYVTGPDGRGVRVASSSSSSSSIKKMKFDDFERRAKESTDAQHPDDGYFDCSHLRTIDATNKPNVFSAWYDTACYLQVAAMHSQKKGMEDVQNSETFRLAHESERRGKSGGSGRYLLNDEEVLHPHHSHRELKRLPDPFVRLRRLTAKFRSHADELRIRGEIARRVLQGVEIEDYHVEEMKESVATSERAIQSAHRDFLETINGGTKVSDELVWSRSSSLKSSSKRRKLIVKTTTSPLQLRFESPDPQFLTCNEGWQLCPSGTACEPVGQCACPAQDVPAGLGSGSSSGQGGKTPPGFIAVNAQMYSLRCYLQTVNPVTLAALEAKCWNDLTSQDSLSPLTSGVNSIQNNIDALQNPTKQKLTCFPMTTGISWRIPATTWDFKRWVASMCGDVRSLKGCNCPGYEVGEYAYEAYWLADVRVFEQVRFWNGWRVPQTFISGIVYVIADDRVDSAWYGAFGWFMPTWFSKYFSIRITGDTVLCAVKHSGDFLWLVVTITGIWFVFISFSKFAFLLSSLIVDSTLGILGIFVNVDERKKNAALFRKSYRNVQELSRTKRDAKSGL